MSGNHIGWAVFNFAMAVAAYWIVNGAWWAVTLLWLALGCKELQVGWMERERDMWRKHAESLKRWPS